MRLNYWKCTTSVAYLLTCFKNSSAFIANFIANVRLSLISFRKFLYRFLPCNESRNTPTCACTFAQCGNSLSKNWCRNPEKHNVSCKNALCGQIRNGWQKHTTTGFLRRITNRSALIIINRINLWHRIFSISSAWRKNTEEMYSKNCLILSRMPTLRENSTVERAYLFHSNANAHRIDRRFYQHPFLLVSANQ